MCRVVVPATSNRSATVSGLVPFAPRGEALDEGGVRRVRDLQGAFATQALHRTDLVARPKQILRWFVMRWQIDGDDLPVSTLVSGGMETQRQWSELAIQRTTTALLGLFSLVTLFAHQRMTWNMEAVRRAAWYLNTSLDLL
jgi:hypothetical protein